MQRTKQIAIILADTLQSIGLHSLLIDYFHPVEVSYFPSFENFITEGGELYDFYFTEAELFLLNSEYFLPRKSKTIVLVKEKASSPGGNFMYVNSSQETIVTQLRSVFAIDHDTIVSLDINKELSLREKDVLQLIVKGSTNKDIADKLNISLNTVLTHRKNITGKLGIKTVSGLTYYAIMNGFLSADDIDG